ncbi:hypothetical protein FOCC_FOCC004279 [Frankliniella occidentalis]|nr:hypothetical protein FOCC_FOCC004279 [Frankliniella occidentalis]
MSGKQFLVLLLLFLAYLMLGAAVFHYIEQAREIKHLEQERRTEEEIVSGGRGPRAKLNNSLDNRTFEDILHLLQDYCGKSFNVDPNRADPYKWHFYNAVFFVITVVSTIGYGNLAPTTTLSRLLMILYALVGIPMNGILLKSLADYFGHFVSSSYTSASPTAQRPSPDATLCLSLSDLQFLRARDKYRAHRHDGMSLAGSILMYFCLGFFVFIISPSFLFMYFEGWAFDEAIYYAFVSLTTIGFGDLVAGQDPYKTDVSYILYKVFLIVWLVFGLGYLFMVLGFITDAMRSKRMAKLSSTIKVTQTKLWNGMVHEMPHLMRRVLNELYLLKVKPVYHDDDDSLCSLNMGERCSSCPDLFWLDDGYSKAAHPFPVVVGLPGAGYRRSSRAAAGCRPRALSEVLPGRLLVRRRSETELGRIDRRATFADTSAPTDNTLDPAELLHEFMNALVNWGGGHMAPGTALPYGGYQGFPDADILSSEWSQQQRLTRQRAKSLAPFTAATDALAEAHYRYGGQGRGQGDDAWDPDDSSTLPADEAGQEQDGTPNNAEWTWSGAGASKRVHELIRSRQNRCVQAPAYDLGGRRSRESMPALRAQIIQDGCPLRLLLFTLIHVRSSRKYVRFPDLIHSTNYGSSAPARLGVGHPALHTCNAGKILPTYQALCELAEAEHDKFQMTGKLSGRKSEAVNRKQQRQDRRLQELHDFERMRAHEEMRQIAKESRQKEKRLRARTMSTGAAETGECSMPSSPSLLAWQGRFHGRR